MNTDDNLTERSPTAWAVARKHYSVREIYWITVAAARTAWATRGTKCDKHASERIMLAVTQVNGCAVCSYAHSRWALDMGLAETEVRGLLAGVADSAPSDELAGLAYAQHYADSRGAPDPAAWAQLTEVYGEDRAQCVLRATRMIMWGNATGIPLSALLARMRGTQDPHSSLAYEVLTALGSMMVLPVALAHAAVAEWQAK
jgi:AhpD family alkylhydroperoxidase